MDVDPESGPARRFHRAFLTTWPAFFKLAESVLCAVCFLCNELSWYPFIPYPARTFLSVCACLSLIGSVVLFLVLGCRMDQHYSNTSWWRILVVALPATCALFLMMSSAAQVNKGGFLSAGFQAAAVFGFLAFSTYLADAMYQFCQLRREGELPAEWVPSFMANSLRKGSRGHTAVPAEDGDSTVRQEVPASWNVPPGSPDQWSQDSDRGAHGTYSLQ